MTGERNVNYSTTGNNRLKVVVIRALIKCIRGLTSSFLNCLIFPKMVSYQKASSRHGHKYGQVQVQRCVLPAVGHLWLTGCSSSTSKMRPVGRLHETLPWCETSSPLWCDSETQGAIHSPPGNHEEFSPSAVLPPHRSSKIIAEPQNITYH